MGGFGLIGLTVVVLVTVAVGRSAIDQEALSEIAWAELVGC